jgi:hypothetical protein
MSKDTKFCNHFSECGISVLFIANLSSKWLAAIKSFLKALQASVIHYLPGEDASIPIHGLKPRGWYKAYRLKPILKTNH